MLKEQKSIKAKFASLDCAINSEICKKYQVIAYPTLLIFNHEDPIYPAFNGGRTVESLVKYLKDVVLKAETYVPKGCHQIGCRVAGFMTVPRVPGTFQIEPHSSDSVLSPQMTNLSHIIHSLHFGERLDPQLERRLPRKQQFLLHPLNGKEFLLSKRHLAPQHYIQIVSTMYEFRDGLKINSYQFTSQNRIAQYANEEIPLAKFSYALSPVSVLISQRRNPFYSFITSLFAIVGGTFTVVSLLNTTLHTFGVHLKKSIHKLS